MKALTFEFHLLEPLLATRVGGGDPNSAAGFDFIPGSMIRGMIIACYKRQKPGDATDLVFRRLFLDGGVRFLNAYPQAYGRRMLPTPLSWYKVKDGDERKPIYDFAVQPWAGNQQWHRVEQPFCYAWQEEEKFEEIRVEIKTKAELLTPEAHINIHTAREDRKRITKGGSTVFRYEALAPEQVFCGVILADQDGNLDILKQWLLEGNMVTLGGSHLAGYGLARLQQVRIVDDWHEYDPIGEKMHANAIIVVTLLSDTLIRNPRTGAYVSTLEPVVGCAHKEAFVSIRVVGGFNRKWNLPLPQAQAIQAGSVFIYPADSDLEKYLLALEVSGIGERCAEGFGRIAINWHRAAEIMPEKKPTPPKPLPVSLSKGSEAGKLAQQMVERMLREQLDRALIAAVNRFKIQNPPSSAQLSRIRIVARRALSQSKLQIIIEHLDPKKMKKAALDQFHRAKIGGERLDEWLRARASDVRSISELLKADRLPTLGGIQPELTDALALEYTVRLIDSVLRKAQKEAANE